MTASSWFSSTSISRSAAWAFDEPKSTPSGTMVALAPPCFSIRRMRATKSSSVFFVFTLLRERRVHVLGVEAPLERRVRQDHVEARGRLLAELLGEGVRERVLVVDVRVVDAVQHQVHRRDAEHGAVEVEAVEHPVLDVVAVRLEQSPV